MLNMGWYKVFRDLPFWPIRMNPQGAVARKLEPDRWRRTTDGGAPRRKPHAQPLRDELGLEVLSINEASKINHLPQYLKHHADAQTRQWAEQLRLGLPLPLESLHRGSKWPREIKPNLEEVMRALAILRRAAHVLGEPLYVFSDDFKDHFSQLALAPSEWPLFCLLSLQQKEVRMISERRLGFGCHPSSKIAQRFSDAILALFREDLDTAEAGHPPNDSPAWRKWREERRHAAEQAGTSLPTELRLYAAMVFTDDPILIVVGAVR